MLPALSKPFGHDALDGIDNNLGLGFHFDVYWITNSELTEVGPLKRFWDEIDRKGRAFSIERSNRCLLYTSPSPRDGLLSRMPSSA